MTSKRSKTKDNSTPEGAKPSRRRARTSQGKFIGNNPETETNEAWEPTDISREVGEKTVDITIKQRIKGPTGVKDAAGKYSEGKKVTSPSGSVTTTFH